MGVIVDFAKYVEGLEQAVVGLAAPLVQQAPNQNTQNVV